MWRERGNGFRDSGGASWDGGGNGGDGGGGHLEEEGDENDRDRANDRCGGGEAQEGDLMERSQLQRHHEESSDYESPLPSLHRDAGRERVQRVRAGQHVVRQQRRPRQ